jgi:hypothetical protein
MNVSTSRLLCARKSGLDSARACRGAAGQGPRGGCLDVDEQARSAQVPKTATLAPGSVVQPKKTVDLESMIFSQGGRLMSNKTTKPWEGSFKHAKKGYGEVHVPADYHVHKRSRSSHSILPGDELELSSLSGSCTTRQRLWESGRGSRDGMQRGLLCAHRAFCRFCL